MSSNPPLVVAVLHSDQDDIDYQLYSEAYGLEMQIDDEWNAEAVLLAPFDHLHAVTKNTGVTGEDTAIVSAGVTDLPLSGSSIPDLSTIDDAKNNWVLVGDPRLCDSDEHVAMKFTMAIEANCRVIICLTDKSHEHIASRLRDLEGVDCSRVVVALVIPESTNTEYASIAAKSFLAHISAVGGSGHPRFIVGGDITGENAAELVNVDGVDGVILMDDKYSDFGTILEVLKALGE